jgi:esterase/lipase
VLAEKAEVMAAVVTVIAMIGVVTEIATTAADAMITKKDANILLNVYKARAL